jgi:hypothetical protein
VQQIVDYKVNGNAWMTSNEFKAFINEFDAEMRIKKKIALILDNAPGHKQVETTNIKLVFLPPKMTGKLQPLYAGIIRAFKAHYRRQQLEYLLDIFENNDNELHNDIFKNITLKDAILFIKYAWDAVSSITITNCWRATNILNNNQPVLASEDRPDINVIQDMINTLTASSVCAASEFINITDEDNVHGI